MSTLKIIFIIAGFMLTQACTMNSLQETAFYAVRNIGQSQCQKRINDSCPAQSYDNYQRDRQQVEEQQ